MPPGRYPVRRRISTESRAISSPTTEPDPALAWRKPSSSRIVVDLPAPFGPRKPKISPSVTSIERSSSARTSGVGCIHGGCTGGARWPYFFERPEVTIAVISRRLRRDADQRRPAAPGDGPCSGQRTITNSSIATGRPLPITVIVSVCLPTDFHDRSKIVARARNVLRRRSTVLMTLPSIAIRALPRVGPTGPTHLIDLAENV